MKRWFLFFAVLFLVGNAHAQTISHYINDNAGVMGPETEEYLEQALGELEQKTNGVQVVVYTENMLPEGMTLEERSLEIAVQNGIGNKEADNGVLLYLAVKDGLFRWEVGYGAEATLNSAWLGRMSRERMIPGFQEGDFESGILYGLAEVEDKLLGTSDSDIAGTNLERPNTSPLYTSWWFMMLVMLFLIIFLARYSGTGSVHSKSDNYAYFIAGASNIFKGGFGRRGLGGGGSFGGGGFSGRI